MTPKPPSAVIEAAHAEHLESLPFEDTADFDAADRGFIAALTPCVVRAADGRVVWDNDAYGFLSGDAPSSVHPSLWRQSTLAAKQGLYEVTDGIYQVRGLDLSNISFIEGDTGIIVIDPLVSTETAAAALALYRAHRSVGLLQYRAKLTRTGLERFIIEAGERLHDEGGAPPLYLLVPPPIFHRQLIGIYNVVGAAINGHPLVLTTPFGPVKIAESDLVDYITLV